MTQIYKTQQSQLPPLVLGSSSPFRKQQLDTLNLAFTQFSPDIDESPKQGETVKQMVARLSLAKAQAVAKKFPDALIITSDQSAEFNHSAIGKPHTYDKAIQQLQSFSGHSIEFHTGLVVIHPDINEPFEYLETTTVQFRQLSESAIRRYIELEQPLNCAGSFKSEGLGVTLFERIDSRDANALIGLPLMGLTDIFYKMGYELPLHSS